MKTVLFINGCLRGKQSRTLKIAKTYIEALKKQGDIELIERNLSEKNISFLSDKSFNETTGKLKLERDCVLAKEFARADEIILAAPFWEFLFPALVNCYIEMISVVGIAFKYTAQGSVGLCKANSLTYIYTAGSNLKDEDKISEKYMQRLSKLYGIPKFVTILSEGLDIEPNCADAIVNDICDKIKNSTLIIGVGNNASAQDPQISDKA